MYAKYISMQSSMLTESLDFTCLATNPSNCQLTLTKGKETLKLAKADTTESLFNTSYALPPLQDELTKLQEQKSSSPITTVSPA
jgi:hypothetical protein